MTTPILSATTTLICFSKEITINEVLSVNELLAQQLNKSIIMSKSKAFSICSCSCNSWGLLHPLIFLNSLQDSIQPLDKLFSNGVVLTRRIAYLENNPFSQID